jgi:SAM-dependent methyltransferase
MKDDPTKNYYETHADEYFHATYAVDLQPLWEKLSKRLEKGDYILDFGSGLGRDLQYFAHRGFRVIGIDYSASLAAACYCRAPGCNKIISFDAPQETPAERLERLSRLSIKGRRKPQKRRSDRDFCDKACYMRWWRRREKLEAIHR